MKDAETKIDGELFTHKYLWKCCEIHSQTADKAISEKSGPIYYELSAMLFAYLSYEAYINFLGEKVAPNAWINERQFFNSDPYRGIAGKLKKICEVCNIKGIDPGKRPYQTVIELCKLRDFLAHGKTDEYDTTIKHSKDKEPELFRNKLYQAVTSEKMKRAMVDVMQFAEFLHRSAATYVQDPFFGNDPFEGITEHSSGDTTSRT